MRRNEDNSKKKKRNYVEVENITNQLMYLGPASSLLRVEFDIKGQPHIIGVDGVAYWEGIPKNEEKRILRNVRKKYPHGFHSRDDAGIEWLKDRLNDLAADHSVTIKAVKPYGCLMVDGLNYDAYKVDIGHIMKFTVYVAMTAFCKEFIVFRPYIQFHEFGPEQNIGFFQWKGIPIISKTHRTIFFRKEIVSYRIYSYEGNKLKSEEYGFRNDKEGDFCISKFGKFMSAVGVRYLD